MVFSLPARGREKTVVGRSHPYFSPGFGSGLPSAPGSASLPSRIQPPAGRRARRWYSGPCFRGSAYSFGLIVQ